MKKILLTLSAFTTIAFITSCTPNQSMPSSENDTNSNYSESTSVDGNTTNEPTTTVDDGEIKLPSTIPSYYGQVSDYEIYGGDGRDIKNHLFNIVSKNTYSLGYDNVWSAFWKTDVRSDGTLWDVYGEYHFKSSQKDNGTGGDQPGQKFNREHTVPQSWFYKEEPTRSDLWHVYPTDKKINNTRSDYLYGEVDDSVALNPTLVGTPSGDREGNEFGSIDETYVTSGIKSGQTVFEPREEYKGDFARGYFMIATRYQNVIKNWDGGGQINHFTKDTYPSLSQYSINLFLKWAHDDPVSEKEIARNEAVYKIQHNRNPFIDVPVFADMIWGDLATIQYK